MPELVNLLASYFNARSAILRTLVEKSPSSTELMDTLQLSREALNRRRKNPDYWLADELSELAMLLHLRLKPDLYTQAITICFRAIDEVDRQRLLKEIHITPSRIKTIFKDSNCWRYSELVQLNQLLNRSKPR